MTAALCPLSCQTQFDAAGRPLKAGRVYVFQAGTTTPAAAYTAPDLATLFSSPIVLPASGRVPPIYLDVGLYDFRITDSAGGLIDQAAGVTGGTADAGAGGSTAIPDFITGDLKPFYGPGTQTGWARCNGRTIGNAASTASEFASDTALALFEHLWNNIPALKATVSGGPGATAATDFTAGKTIQLPDLRGRAFFGLDGMGSTAAGIITAATTTTPDQVGTTLGDEALTLTAAQMPSHTHTASAAPAGGHTPTGTTDEQGAHTHAITVAGVGDHTHGASADTQGAHSHNASSDVQGDHTHSVPFYVLNATGSGGSTQTTLHEPTNIATGNNGSHFHNISVATAGAHSHNIGIGNAGGHTHAAGSDSQGLHNHNLTLAAVADHTHAISVASTGDGNSAPSMPPGFLGTWLIRL